MAWDTSIEMTVVVPAYNEEGRLNSTLPRLWGSLEKRFAGFEIIVVDDGSTDGTGKVARRFSEGHPEARLIRYEKNRGKGHAVRTGVLAARGKYVLFSDADLSTPVGEVRKLLEALEKGCDIAIGSRSGLGARVLKRQPLYRVLMGKTFNRIVRFLAVRGIEDTQCGFKCFRRHVARELFSLARIDGFSFDVEALYIARRKGMSIREVGVLWRDNRLSKVNPILHPLQMLKDLIVIRGNGLCGFYGSKELLRSRIEA